MVEKPVHDLEMEAGHDGCIHIGQYYGTSLTSRLIRWRTWSDISHTSAFLPGGLDQVIEAWGGSVARRHWTRSHTPGTRIDLFRVACSLAQQHRFYEFLHQQVGKPYDYFAILGFATRARLQSNQAWFCSELVFAAALAAGIELLARIEPYQVSPGDLQHSPLLAHVGTLVVPGAGA